MFGIIAEGLIAVLYVMWI